MSVIQPPDVAIDPADAIALTGLVLVGIGAWLVWSIAVALLVVGVVMLVAVLIGMIRRSWVHTVAQAGNEFREINP